MDEMKEDFRYTYAPQPKEEKEVVKRILQQYIPQEENLVDRLRKLDEKAKNPGIILALVMGVIGTLILGTGLSMVMVWGMMITGIFVGLIGMAVAALAYPAYLNMIKKGKAKYASEILRISKVVLNQ